MQTVRALPVPCTRELDPSLNLTSTCYSYRTGDSNLQTSTLYSAGMEWGTFQDNTGDAGYDYVYCENGVYKDKGYT